MEKELSIQEKLRIVQELVPGKQITLAHIIANPDEILYKKLGLDPSVDYSKHKCAIGLVTMSPAEYAIIGADLAVKKVWDHVNDYASAAAECKRIGEALAKELAPSGIRVNCISPGVIMTDMMKDFSEEDLDLIKEDIPLGSFGTPLDIANLALFLADDKAKNITGQNISSNGGQVI